jgi:hypothetical protein
LLFAGLTANEPMAEELAAAILSLLSITPALVVVVPAAAVVVDLTIQSLFLTLAPAAATEAMDLAAAVVVIGSRHYFLHLAVQVAQLLATC